MAQRKHKARRLSAALVRLEPKKTIVLSRHGFGGMVLLSNSVPYAHWGRLLNSGKLQCDFWGCSVISGADLTRNPKYNKGLAFTETERDRLYLRGLLPPAILSQDVQVRNDKLLVHGKTTFAWNLQSGQHPHVWQRLKQHWLLVSILGRTDAMQQLSGT